MGLARVFTRGLRGLDAPLVTVEVHVAGGLPAMNIVGLPEASVREARDRVRSAIQNSGFDYPASRVTINLAPADLPKEGGAFDLPIAVGILAASGQLNSQCLDDVEMLGELSLNGELRPIRGALPVAMAVAKTDRALILPEANASEAALVGELAVHSAKHLVSLIASFNGSQALPKTARPEPSLGAVSRRADMADVRGQQQAKRAMVVAAAGGHNVVLEGPPGSGKSMLAKRLPGILPPLSQQEALEVAAIRSLVGEPIDMANFAYRQPRVVHHTASIVALIGGAKPGEITRAHHSVLFLDEVLEYPRKSLEALRDPLENGYIDISRANFRYRYPAQFQLVMAMNPCPCGDPDNCRDTPDQIRRYRGKLSGPIMDRMDIHLQIPRVKRDELMVASSHAELGSEAMLAQVVAARAIQETRQGKPNASLEAAELERCAMASEAAQHLLAAAMEKMNLTARGYHRLLKVARTVADLAASEFIEASHMAEAIAYRQLEQ